DRTQHETLAGGGATLDLVLDRALELNIRQGRRLPERGQCRTRPPARGLERRPVARDLYRRQMTLRRTQDGQLDERNRERSRASFELPGLPDCLVHCVQRVAPGGDWCDLVPHLGP